MVSVKNRKGFIKQFFASYGMIFALLALCIYFSCVTYREQAPVGKDAAISVVDRMKSENIKDGVLIIGANSASEENFTAVCKDLTEKAGIQNIYYLNGNPLSLNKKLKELDKNNVKLNAMLISGKAASWKLIEMIPKKFPDYANTKVLKPESYMFPDFLKKSNIMAIADRIVVIAIIAIGMTMVIITGGIDLSVGSFIALSAVVGSYFIVHFAGAVDAGAMGILLGFLAGILVCALTGIFSGIMVTYFSVAPFIVTLAMMMVARGMAYIIAGGQSIYRLPDGITWLGRGADLFGIPNTIVLMMILYIAAHLIMSKTTFGRYIYAVGGNEEAARLSGVPTKWILFSVYVICSCLAGLGGIIQASQLKSGAPTYGNMYELFVIAAVVVGGTSLNGGEGKIFGTLIGAFIIAVIQNGMNLIGVESYTQYVVLGLVILAAVVMDKAKKQGHLLMAIKNIFIRKKA